ERATGTEHAKELRERPPTVVRVVERFDAPDLREEPVADRDRLEARGHGADAAVEAGTYRESLRGREEPRQHVEDEHAAAVRERQPTRDAAETATRVQHEHVLPKVAVSRQPLERPERDGVVAVDSVEGILTRRRNRSRERLQRVDQRFLDDRRRA